MFADDMALCGESVNDAELQFEEWRRSMETCGMKISKTKTEYMSEGAQDDRVELAGVEIKKMKAFKYFG